MSHFNPVRQPKRSVFTGNEESTGDKSLYKDVLHFHFLKTCDTKQLKKMLDENRKAPSVKEKKTPGLKKVTGDTVTQTPNDDKT